MSNAAARRFEALKTMCATVQVTELDAKAGHYVNRFLISDRAEIAKRIRDLQRLGRTDRWQGALEGWAQMVEDTDNPLEWAFLQGSIYASNAHD